MVDISGIFIAAQIIDNLIGNFMDAYEAAKYKKQVSHITDMLKQKDISINQAINDLNNVINSIANNKVFASGYAKDMLQRTEEQISMRLKNAQNAQIAVNNIREEVNNKAPIVTGSAISRIANEAAGVMKDTNLDLDAIESKIKEVNKYGV